MESIWSLFLISPFINVKFFCGSRLTKESPPNNKLSKPNTSYFFPNNNLTKTEPIYPAAPVTNILSVSLIPFLVQIGYLSVEHYLEN